MKQGLDKKEISDNLEYYRDVFLKIAESVQKYPEAKSKVRLDEVRFLGRKLLDLNTKHTKQRDNIKIAPVLKQLY